MYACNGNWVSVSFLGSPSGMWMKMAEEKIRYVLILEVCTVRTTEE